MKQFITLSTERRILISVSVILIAVAVFYFFVAEAVTPRTVGSLSISFVPNGGIGNEYVEVEYAGFGQASFDGWSIENSGGEVFEMTGIVVASTEKLRICEKDSGDGNCDEFWESNDSFNDVSDSLIIRDEYGGESVRIDYSSAGEGEVKNGDGNYVADVYGKNGKVAMCHQDNKGAYKYHNVSVNSLIKGLEKNNNTHATHDNDVIQDFMYDTGKGLGYFPGVNWDETGEALVADGC